MFKAVRSAGGCEEPVFATLRTDKRPPPAAAPIWEPGMEEEELDDAIRSAERQWEHDGTWRPFAYSSMSSDAMSSRLLARGIKPEKSFAGKLQQLKDSEGRKYDLNLLTSSAQLRTLAVEKNQTGSGYGKDCPSKRQKIREDLHMTVEFAEELDEEGDREEGDDDESDEFDDDGTDVD
jgi:hypothetical protein